MARMAELVLAAALTLGAAGALPAAVADTKDVPADFVLIEGGSFMMGSPESEPWRGSDETQHQVSVSSFYMSRYEVTQELYEQVMGSNPSNFHGARLPVENISWLDAVNFCNALSLRDGRTPVYQISGSTVTWDRSADGYRLPTEAEWEYACRAGSTEPFNIPVSPGDQTANFYAHYPYGIEENYFSQQNLTVKPGYYRQTTVDVGSFEPNAYGLYDMHGNVGEWVYDVYGPYDTAAQSDPTGQENGQRRVYRGGGWNDFAKNLRSAYRAALDQDKHAFNLGLRLVLNAAGVVSTAAAGSDSTAAPNRLLVAYFSWSGNTRGIAEEIARQTGANLFEITMMEPYSSDYNEVLRQAQQAQRRQDRPPLASRVENFSYYQVILLGYPNWWASIPMPIASFLESYDFAGKRILPFCSHGGGRMGQSISAITKLVPEADISDPLSVRYSGGGSLSSDITAWLEQNGIELKRR